MSPVRAAAPGARIIQQRGSRVARLSDVYTETGFMTSADVYIRADLNIPAENDIEELEVSPVPLACWREPTDTRAFVLTLQLEVEPFSTFGRGWIEHALLTTGLGSCVVSYGPGDDDRFSVPLVQNIGTAGTVHSYASEALDTSQLREGATLHIQSCRFFFNTEESGIVASCVHDGATTGTPWQSGEHIDLVFNHGSEPGPPCVEQPGVRVAEGADIDSGAFINGGEGELRDLVVQSFAPDVCSPELTNDLHYLPELDAYISPRCSGFTANCAEPEFLIDDTPYWAIGNSDSNIDKQACGGELPDLPLPLVTVLDSGPLQLDDGFMDQAFTVVARLREAATDPAESWRYIFAGGIGDLLLAQTDEGQFVMGVEGNPLWTSDSENLNKEGGNLKSRFGGDELCLAASLDITEAPNRIDWRLENYNTRAIDLASVTDDTCDSRCNAGGGAGVVLHSDSEWKFDTSPGSLTTYYAGEGAAGATPWEVVDESEESSSGEDPALHSVRFYPGRLTAEEIARICEMHAPEGP